MTSFFNLPIVDTALSLILVCALLSLLVSSITEIINERLNERGNLLHKTIKKLFDDGMNANFGEMLYKHPMITNLGKKANVFPQYISDATFSQVMLEVIGNYAMELAFDPATNTTTVKNDIEDPVKRFRAGVNKMKYSGLKLMLQNMAEKSQALSGPNSGTPMANLEKQLKQWYNDQMDRMSGWYKDNIKRRLRIVAFCVAIFLNVDSIHLFQTIYNDPELRTELTMVSERVAENYKQAQKDTTLSGLQKELAAAEISNLKANTSDTGRLSISKNIISNLNLLDKLSGAEDSANKANFEKTRQQLDVLESLDLPIGWEPGDPPLNWLICARNKISGKDSVCRYACDTLVNGEKTDQLTVYFTAYRRCTPGNIFLYLAGILLTTFATSLGAPFWFDLLLKFVNIRKAGNKPSTTTND